VVANAFLKSNVVFEPLIRGWYAWLHLLAPAQSALNLKYRQIPLLESFLEHPDVHANAAANPKLFGGPFVQLRREQEADVRKHLFGICSTFEREIRFAEILAAACQRVAKESGHSLSKSYAELPPELAGLVEFVYDANHHARLRLHERILYANPPRTGGEAIELSICESKDRAFFMNTPRLKCRENPRVELAFASELVDQIAAARTKPTSPNELAEALKMDEQQRERLFELFTESGPSSDQREFSGEGVRVRYFGHACVLMQTREFSLLIDPVFATDRAAGNSLTIADLPDRIDCVIITHGHQDHCAIEWLLQVRHRVDEVWVPRNNSGSLVDPSLELMLRQAGFRKVRSLEPLDVVDIPGGRVVSLPFSGEHVDLECFSRQGLLIEMLGRRIGFLVDSDGRDSALYGRIADLVGANLDALFLGMECHGAPLSWLYGPTTSRPLPRKDDESRRLSGMDCERAVAVLSKFEVNNIFVYAMGQEPWLRYLMGLEYTPESIQLREVAKFLSVCRQQGKSAEQLFLSKELML